MNAYSLLDDLLNVEPKKPNKQILLYSPISVKNPIEFGNLLAQFKWCLDNNDTSECYDEIKHLLSRCVGTNRVDILVRQYKQVRKRNTKLMNIF